MSRTRIYFEEIQPQKGNLAFMILLALTVIGFSSLYFFGNNDEEDARALIYVGTGLSLVFIILFFVFRKMRLETAITQSGIYFRYPPFQNKFHKISLSEIRNWEVREYNPVKEYGGWGFKKQGKPRNKNTGYMISGKTALFLNLKNGHEILIGTQRKDAMIYAMRKITEH